MSNPEKVFREFYGSIGYVNNVVQLAFERGMESLVQLDFAKYWKFSLFAFCIFVFATIHLLLLIILLCTRSSSKKLHVVVINCKHHLPIRRSRNPVEILSKPM